MKKIKSILKYHLALLFLIILILPAFNGTFGIFEFQRKAENRVFKDSLDIDFTNLDVFPKDFNRYYNDNFSFRTPLLNFYHYMKFYYFKVSPNPQKTIIGNNNWFFLSKKEIQIYEGKFDFSEKELGEFEKEWIRRKSYLDSLNIKCYWLIAPIKHNIYSEYLPFNIKKRKSKTRVNQLKDYFKESLPDLIIDPAPKLFSAKKNQKVFYQLDNHWNLTAGYITSKQILSRVKEDFPEIEINDIPAYDWKDSTLHFGIHYSVIGIEELSEKDSFPIIKKQHSLYSKKYGFPPLKGFAYPRKYEMRYLNKSVKSGLKILVIRDSFGSQIIPFLKEPFKESVFIFDAWHYNLNKSIIEVVKPDVVVFIQLDTHLESIIRD